MRRSKCESKLSNEIKNICTYIYIYVQGTQATITWGTTNTAAAKCVPGAAKL